MELNITKFIKKETNLKDGNKSQKFTERELNVLIYKALKEQLILYGVSHQRERLIDFCTKLELKAKQYSYLIPDEDFIDEYLKEQLTLTDVVSTSCGKCDNTGVLWSKDRLSAKTCGCK